MITGGGRKGEFFNGYGVSDLQDKKVLDLLHDNVNTLY